jgi:hypothetical protein
MPSGIYYSRVVTHGQEVGRRLTLAR